MKGSSRESCDAMPWVLPPFHALLTCLNEGQLPRELRLRSRNRPSHQLSISPQ